MARSRLNDRWASTSRRIAPRPASSQDTAVERQAEARCTAHAAGSDRTGRCIDGTSSSAGLKSGGSPCAPGCSPRRAWANPRTRRHSGAAPLWARLRECHRNQDPVQTVVVGKERGPARGNGGASGVGRGQSAGPHAPPGLVSVTDPGADDPCGLSVPRAASWLRAVTLVSSTVGGHSRVGTSGEVSPGSPRSPAR